MAQNNLVLTFDRNIDIPAGKGESLCYDPIEENILRADDVDGVVAGDIGCFGCYKLSTPTVPIHTLLEADFLGTIGTSETSTTAHNSELEVIAYNPLNKRMYILNNNDPATSPTQAPAIYELQWNPLAGAAGEYEITNFISLPAKEVVNPQCATFGPDGILYIGDNNSASDTMDVYTLDINFASGCTYSTSIFLTFDFNTPPMDGTSSGGVGRGFGLAYHDEELYCIGYQGNGSGGVRFKRFISVSSLDTRKKVAYYNLNTTVGGSSKAPSGKTRGITIISGEVYTVVNPSAATTNAIGVYTLPTKPIEYDTFMGRDYLDGYNTEHPTETGDGVSVATAVGSVFTAVAGQCINSSLVMGTATGASTETCNIALYKAEEYTGGKFRPTGPILYTSSELTLAVRGSSNGGVFYRAEPVQEGENFKLTGGELYLPVFYATGTNDSAYLNAQQLVARDPEDPDAGEAATDDGTGGTPPNPYTSTDVNYLAAPTFGFGISNGNTAIKTPNFLEAPLFTSTSA